MYDTDRCIWMKGEGHFVPSDTQYYNDRVFGLLPDGTYGFIHQVDGVWVRLPRVPLG